MLNRIRSVALLGTLAACLLAAGNAHASDCYAPQYVWKTITVNVEVEKPYLAFVTKYNHCGTAYQVPVVRYTTVVVPVQKKVKIYL